MTDKLTITFIGELGQKFATSRDAPALEAAACRLPLVNIRIGFEQVTLTRKTLGEMLTQLQLAEAGGASYPDDYRPMAEAGYRLSTVEETSK